MKEEYLFGSKELEDAYYRHTNLKNITNGFAIEYINSYTARQFEITENLIEFISLYTARCIEKGKYPEIETRGKYTDRVLRLAIFGLKHTHDKDLISYIIHGLEWNSVHIMDDINRQMKDLELSLYCEISKISTFDRLILDENNKPIEYQYITDEEIDNLIEKGIK